MKLAHRVSVFAPRERVWSALMDVPSIARCIPGVETVVPAGAERYRGRFRVGIGPVRLGLEGDLLVSERDEAAGRAVMRADGADARIGGGVRAVVTLTLVTADSSMTELLIESDVQLLGRIGELGQPLIKRKADDIMAAFSACLGRLMTAT